MYHDIFATKGIEYLLVLLFLALLVPFWLSLDRRQIVRQARRTAGRLLDLATGWFRVPDDTYFHPGHAWAVPDEEDGVMRVGMDDFSSKLLGSPEAIRVPATGTVLEQGERGWNLTVAGREVEMLSPVRGEVVEINQEVLENPGRLGDDPYHQGWLLRVRVANPKGTMRSLLSGDLARAWMDENIGRLRRHMGGDLGTMLQDGGLPVSGFARELSPDHWEELVSEYLLTS